MRKFTDHCDLCGKQITCNKENGWEGSFLIKRVGNVIVQEEMGESGLDLCKTCGESITHHIMSLRSEFVVKCIVEPKEVVA